MISNKSILISGAGISGLTLAYWLQKRGFSPVIVAKRVDLHERGYGKRERYDLVVGAGGIHSNVRQLMWGAESQFNKFLLFYRRKQTGIFLITNRLLYRLSYCGLTISGGD